MKQNIAELWFQQSSCSAGIKLVHFQDNLSRHFLMKRHVWKNKYLPLNLISVNRFRNTCFWICLLRVSVKSFERSLELHDVHFVNYDSVQGEIDDKVRNAEGWGYYLIEKLLPHCVLMFPFNWSRLSELILAGDNWKEDDIEGLVPHLKMFMAQPLRAVWEAKMISGGAPSDKDGINWYHLGEDDVQTFASPRVIVGDLLQSTAVGSL